MIHYDLINSFYIHPGISQNALDFLNIMVAQSEIHYLGKVAIGDKLLLNLNIGRPKSYK